MRRRFGYGFSGTSTCSSIHRRNSTGGPFTDRLRRLCLGHALSCLHLFCRRRYGERVARLRAPSGQIRAGITGMRGQSERGRLGSAAGPAAGPWNHGHCRRGGFCSEETARAVRAAERLAGRREMMQGSLSCDGRSAPIPSSRRRGPGPCSLTRARKRAHAHVHKCLALLPGAARCPPGALSRARPRARCTAL